jgi:serine protease Do
MKHRVRATVWAFSVLILTACGAATAITPVATPSATSPAQASVALPAAADLNLEDLYQRISASVVQITVISKASGSSLLGSGNVQTVASGSGFVWDAQGDIVTNNHVVENADSVTVSFPEGTRADATIVGTDPGSDLAVIRVAVDSTLLKPVTLGDSDTVRVGQPAAVIGYPFGLDSTMTAGIVSGLSRLLPVSSSDGSGLSYSVPDVIQTDAPINPGNSGGVLVDERGEVIGVPSANISTSGSSAGVGFAIPANIVRMVVPYLIDTGSYPHAYLGISGGTLTAELASAMGLDPDTRGVLIATVQSGGPADSAGLRGSSTRVTLKEGQTTVGGDVITAADGNPIADFEDLIRYMFLNKKIGDMMQLTVIRDMQTITVDVNFPAPSGG